METVKRFIGVILILTMMLTMATACGSSDEPTAPVNNEDVAGNQDDKEDVVDDDTATVNEFGWVVPKEPIEFSAYDARQLNPDEQEKSTTNMENYLEEKFNVKINRIMSDADPTERLNLALASNDYPEVIYNMPYAEMLKWAEMGKLVEITPMLDTVGTNAKLLIGDLLPLYLDENDKLWGTPIGMRWLDIPDYSAHLRWDWWNEMGRPEINTPDDFYEVTMQMLNEHPTNENGETVYSISLYDQGNPNNFVGYWGLKNGWKIDSNNDFTYWAFTEEGKEMTKWWNKFWRSGTMDPDSFINKFEEWKTKFSNERIVSAVGGWWIAWHAGHEVWLRTDEDWDEEKRYFQVTFKAPDAEAAYLSPKDSFGSGFTVITDKAEDPESIMKFIDFCATTPGRALTAWGIPNGIKGDKIDNLANWHINSPDDWYIDETAKKSLLEETYDYSEYDGNLGTGVFQFISDVSRWEDGVHCGWMNQMWLDQNKWKKILQENTAGTIYDFTAARVVYKPDDPMKLIEQAVTDAWKQYWPLCVQANSDAELEEAWQNLQDALTAAGIEEYTQFRSDSYKKNMELLGN